MNKHLLKGIAVAVASTVVLTTVGAVKLYAEDKITDAINKEEIEETLSGVIVSGNQADKEETVYVLTDAAGSVNKVIVSDHLYNTNKEDKLSDISDLSNIMNMKGYEEFVTEGSQLTWNAAGNPIYYQGTSDKQIPVTITVKYFLDGVEKTAAEIAGAKGRVTIRFDYTNNLQLTAKDSNEKYYVPFVALTGTFLDTDNFKNISVTNGRVIDDGDRVYCLGMALPGLKSDLGLTEDSIDIPEYFEISADTESFELLTTLSMVTNEPFNHLDFSGIDSTNPAGSADLISQLKDATSQLAEGSKALYNGLVELKAGMDSLKDGATKLENGANALHNGTTSLATGAGSLSAGAAQVAAGAGNLSSGAGQVSAGAGQVATGAAQVAAGTDSLNSGLSQLTQNSAALNAGGKQVFEAILASATSQLQAAGVPVDQLTIENYAQTLDNTALYLESVGMASAAQQVKAVKAQLDSVNAFYTGLNAYTQGVDQAAAGANQLAGGASNLATGAANLATGANQLASGAKDLATGANQVASGASSLADGATALDNGAAELATGTAALNSGIDQLIDGTNKLTEGAETLSAALAEIDAEANEFFMEISDNLAAVFDKLNTTIEISKQYNNFSGLAEGMNGSVKFIYRTGAVEK